MLYAFETDENCVYSRLSWSTITLASIALPGLLERARDVRIYGSLKPQRLESDQPVGFNYRQNKPKSKDFQAVGLWVYVGLFKLDSFDHLRKVENTIN